MVRLLFRIKVEQFGVTAKMLAGQTLRSLDRPLFIALALGAGGVASLLVMLIDNPLHLLVAVAGVLTVIGMTLNPELGLLVLVFTTYTRFSDIMIKYHGMPSVAKLLVPLLFGLVVVRWVWSGKRPRGWRRSLLIVTGYGFIGFLSLLYASDFERTEEALISYAKDATIAVLATILIHRAATFRRVIWTLLAVGIFLGTISVYQHLSGTFENEYWGFGQAKIRNIVGRVEDYRISGPLGGPNEYAQMLVVLVPLALDRLWGERTRLLRVFAAWALVVCVLSIVFTFSRGGFIALVGTLMVMFIRRPPGLLALLITIMVAVPLVQFIPEQYTERMQTVVDLFPGSEQDAREEISFRGRLSENTSAWLMFTDRPLLGVGLDNFPIYYQEYSRRLGLDPRREIRSAHSLYLQIAADQGLLGLTAFGVVLWIVFRGMHKGYQDFIRAGSPDYANMTVALSVGIIGFLIGGIFLHLIYPRFLWLLIGIALAVPHVAKRELRERGEALDRV